MAGWLHGVFVGDWLFVFPLCGFSLSLFCNYGGPGRQGKVCQHRRGRGLAGAHRSRHPNKERCNKIQTPQIHVPRGHTAQGSCRVEQERDNTVAATTGIRLVGSSASNTASAWSDPEHSRKRSSLRTASATELSRPKIHWHSNSRCSMWRHLCSLAACALGAEPKSGHKGKP